MRLLKAQDGSSGRPERDSQRSGQEHAIRCPRFRKRVTLRDFFGKCWKALVIAHKSPGMETSIVSVTESLLSGDLRFVADIW
jgi:hypothetical protein